jgi:hypothetical protein
MKKLYQLLKTARLLLPDAAKKTGNKITLLLTLPYRNPTGSELIMYTNEKKKFYRIFKKITFLYI